MKRKWYQQAGLILLLVFFYGFSKTISQILAIRLGSIGGENFTRIMQFTLIGGIFSTLIVIWYSNRFLNLDGSKLWLKDRNILKNYALGFVAGTILYISFISMALVTKNISYSGKGEISALNAMIYLPAFMIQSFDEEIFVRGAIQRLIKGKWGVIPSIITPSFIFAALHLPNPGVNIFAVINIFLVGIIFALMVYYTESIWYAAAAHASWNYMMGVVFGQKVSGIDLQNSVLNFPIIGKNEIFTGGNFGPEGTVFVTVILLIGVIYYYFRTRKKYGNLRDYKREEEIG